MKASPKATKLVNKINSGGRHKANSMSELPSSLPAHRRTRICLGSEQGSCATSGDAAAWIVNCKQTTSLAASYGGGMAPIIPI